MQPGQLFYLMGASGVGKDSLLDYLRAHLPVDARVLLARRYITRPAGVDGENHIAITPEAFRERQARGAFAMHWRSHGFEYGIDRRIDDDLSAGWQVVVNGSRHYLESARRRYPTLQPILVSVSHDQLFERLVKRGREGPEDIERRLQRAETLDAQLADQSLYRLRNDGPLEVAGNQLLEMIMGVGSEARTSPRAAAASG
ncbi:MAG: phosphonate metabolism protein/1,5-bisphosphokinase (PRPP-forming) PhnN [Candidatus Thiodiazotropha sp.]|jgi:ribose 1,5-bisphosphokinase